MSHPAKYRAWDRTDKKMLYFEGIFNNRPFTERSTFPQYESCPKYHDLVVMQYTGLHDRNGKEVYEGDIIENKVYGGVAVICWGIKDESYCGWGIRWIAPEEKRHRYDLLYNENLENCEIVGHIHARPYDNDPTFRE